MWNNFSDGDAKHNTEAHNFLSGCHGSARVHIFKNYIKREHLRWGSPISPFHSQSLTDPLIFAHFLDMIRYWKSISFRSRMKNPSEAPTKVLDILIAEKEKYTIK